VNIDSKDYPFIYITLKDSIVDTLIYT